MGQGPRRTGRHHPAVARGPGDRKEHTFDGRSKRTENTGSSLPGTLGPKARADAGRIWGSFGSQGSRALPSSVTPSRFPAPAGNPAAGALCRCFGRWRQTAAEAAPCATLNETSMFGKDAGRCLQDEKRHLAPGEGPGPRDPQSSRTTHAAERDRGVQRWSAPDSSL